MTAVYISPAQNQEPGMGQLKLEGSNIELLVLNSIQGKKTQTFSKPQETITLPVGIYYVQQITLTNGFYCNTRNERITITQAKPAVLKVGGPLKQTIEVKRQGTRLNLGYKLTGIGGDNYIDPNRTVIPGFTVYKGEKIIASGNFMYG
jgi:hypothetical protein